MQNDDAIRNIKASRYIEVPPLTEGEIKSITSILGINLMRCPQCKDGGLHILHLISELHKESRCYTAITTLKIHQNMGRKIEKDILGTRELR